MSVCGIKPFTEYDLGRCEKRLGGLSPSAAKFPKRWFIF